MAAAAQAAAAGAVRPPTRTTTASPVVSERQPGGPRAHPPTAVSAAADGPTLDQLLQHIKDESARFAEEAYACMERTRTSAQQLDEVTAQLKAVLQRYSVLMLSPGVPPPGAGSQRHDSQWQAERLIDEAKRRRTEQTVLEEAHMQDRRKQQDFMDRAAASLELCNRRVSF